MSRSGWRPCSPGSRAWPRARPRCWHGGHDRAAYPNIGRLDLILAAEADSINRYKLAEQADVLMLLYLLGPDGLLRAPHRLGYRSAPDELTRTVDYCLARTADGSTPRRTVHAAVLALIDPSRAWRTFRDALAADLDDTLTFDPCAAGPVRRRPACSHPGRRGTRHPDLRTSLPSARTRPLTPRPRSRRRPAR